VNVSSFQKRNLSFRASIVKGYKIWNVSNTMPANYLRLARDVVDALGRAENNQPLQFNEIQCVLLKQKLQETVTPLLSRVDKDSLPPEKHRKLASSSNQVGK
jgi:hypothetical protein